MQVAKDKVVTFEFKVTNEDGEVLDSSEWAGAYPYIHGNGYLIPGLESAMEGKAPSDSFSVTVPPELGYGERDDSIIQAIPKDRFEGIDLEIGLQLQASYEGMSRVVTGKVRNTSYEPVLNSSEKSLMVTAGITKVNMSGSLEKKSRKSARPSRKKTEKNDQPVATKKTTITIYAIGELKKNPSSLFMMRVDAFTVITSASAPLPRNR